MRRPLLSLLAAAVLIAPCMPGMCGETAPGRPWLRATPEAMQQWQGMRFGMFLCWGPVSLTGREIGWSRGAPAWGRRPGVRGGRGPTPAQEYDALYTKWKPGRFDAGEWVRLAQDAGMKYMIFLVKHHDGFCLYDTKLTDYKCTGAASAWKVDVMKQVADACHAAGLKLIIYYSQPDWHHPDYLGEHHARYVQYLHGQVRELLTDYGRIDGLWFDNLRGASAETAKLWDAEKLFKMARELQPHLIINNRCGLPGDYDTPEQKIGRFQADRPWESCITLGTQWSWKPKDKVKSFEESIRILAGCATGNGNLALNTNPMPDGRIEPRQAARFREIGRWLELYGESIYGTRGGPFLASATTQAAHRAPNAPASGAWGGSTHKGNVVYLHVMRWPAGGIVLPPIPRRVVSHSVLTGGEAVVRQTDQRITVSVAPEHRSKPDTIVRLLLDGPAEGLTPQRSPSGSLALGKPAAASNFYRNDPTYAPARAFDDDPGTRWGCDWGTHSAWLAVDLGKPQAIARAAISEPYGRVRKFELQVKDGATWRTFHSGTTIGPGLSAEFAPVTGRHIRLNILDTTDGPSIWEFQLFAPGK